MAVSITKKFFNTKTSREWTDLAKIVFTSPNMDSDPANPKAAGSRSHILPGSDYIGTWYEAVDFMYRIKTDQSYITDNSKECYFSEIFLRQPTFDFGSDTTFSGLCLYDPQITASGIIQYDRSNYASITSAAYQGTVSIEGTTYRKYDFTLYDVTGTTTISGAWATTSGVARVYNWDDNATNTSWSHAGNSIVFEVTNGEAYSCRLTAWDDDSHTGTTNQVLDELHYKVVAYAYKSGYFQAGKSEGTQKEYPSSNNIVDSMVYPPGINIALKGDVSYYGDFDLIHVPVEYTEHGEYLAFTPYLYGMDDTFTAGNYDFVTTLHYQYT
jgi:hypothetical protein